MNFQFVDRIYNYEKNTNIQGCKLISLEEYFLNRPHGRKKAFPELLLVESIIQLASWLTIISSDFEKIAILSDFEKISFLKTPSAGDKLLLEVKVDTLTKETLSFNAFIKIKEEVIFEALNLSCILEDINQYYDPEDLKVKFEELFISK